MSHKKPKLDYTPATLRPSMPRAPRKPRKVDPLKQPGVEYERYDPKVHK